MDMREIYQDVILDHYRHPRNYAVLGDANHRAKGHNPLCGDRVEISLRIEDGIVQDASFEGAGCAISTASASMMTEVVKGKSIAEVEKLFEQFHHMVTGKEDHEIVDLGKLEALAGVREIPVRVKCATLAWHTMKSALENSVGKVSTE